MTSVELLAKSLNMVNYRLGTVASSVQPDEWTRRAVPGTNLPAFTFWHSARGIDSVINFQIRGVPEVSERDPWRADPVMGLPGLGVGYTLAEADALAHRISIERVLAYASDVRADVSRWLKTIGDDFLLSVPNTMERRAASPAYGDPANVAASRPLDGQPVWTIILGSCFGHVWAHLEEIQLLVGVLRASEMESGRK